MFEFNLHVALFKSNTYIFVFFGVGFDFFFGTGMLRAEPRGQRAPPCCTFSEALVLALVDSDPCLEYEYTFIYPI